MLRPLKLSVAAPALSWLCLTSAISTEKAPRFREISLHTDKGSHFVAVADVNRDGKPDILVANDEAGTVSVLLGDGKGNFHEAKGSPIPAGHLPNDADFNHDGNPDVVTTNLDDDTVTILLGDGKGGFKQAQGSPFPAGAKPWEVAIDDFNKDGNADLAIIPYERDVTDPHRVAVTVLLGDGKGGFRPLQTQSLSLEGCRGPNSIATGDINGDGYRDIVVLCAESNNLVIFLGTREGNVFRRVTHASAGGWGGVAVADVNKDGRDDVITANEGDGSATLYLSQ